MITLMIEIFIFFLIYQSFTKLFQQSSFQFLVQLFDMEVIIAMNLKKTQVLNDIILVLIKQIFQYDDLLAFLLLVFYENKFLDPN